MYTLMAEDKRDVLETVLPDILREIRANDTNYDERYRLVLIAVSLANQCGYKAGFRLDPEEPEWPVAFLELPGEGQVSWHCPPYPDAYDGHSTDEKYARIERYAGKR